MEFIKNPLYGKRVVFDGDSLCCGEPTEGRFSWAPIIGERNAMEWKNYGVGGGTMTAELYFPSSGKPRHWLSRHIDKVKEMHPELDYLILEGGTNDADLLNAFPEKFGEYTPEDYSGKYDDTTFTGAVETLFYKAINYYPETKMGYIVLHKMGFPENGYGPDYKRRRFFLRVIELCKKWGIPYLDLWESSPLNPQFLCYYDRSMTPQENQNAGKAYMDSQHLTTAGYNLISDRIETWMRSL